MHVERGNLRISAVDGRALKQAASDTAPACAFQHRYAVLRRALVTFGRKIGQMPNADQDQSIVEDAKNRVAREVDVRHVVFNYAIGHDLAEAQKAVVFVE